MTQADLPTVTSGAEGIVATACHDDADTVVTGVLRGTASFLRIACGSRSLSELYKLPVKRDT